MAAADQGVKVFRELMQAEQYQQIYVTASDELRSAVSEGEMIKIMSAVNRKLGKVRTAEKAGWHVNVHTSGRFVTINFKTEFERGTGTEQFVFRISDGKATLVRYNVNSSALLTN